MKTETSPSGPIDSSTDSLYIGKPPSNAYYYGKSDEVAIYDRALSADELEQHYQNGLDGLGYEVIVPATIDIDPDPLNLSSKGKWITAYIEFPDDYDVSNIDVSTTMINDQVQAEARPTKIGDHDNDGIPDLMVKFDRQELISLLEIGDATLTVSGELADGTMFEGSDVIGVMGKE